MKSLAICFTIVLSILFLSACGGGGGGGGDSSTPTVNNDLNFSDAIAETTPVQSNLDEFIQLANAFSK